MSATDELRRLLDGRGVEWWNETDPEPQSITMARTDGRLIEYHENANGSTGYHIFNVHDLTPAQAVEATLGRGEQPPYDELIEALRRDWGIEASWDGLRRFWYVGLTDEGVRKRDERDATLGRGECRDAAGKQIAFFSCSACGATTERKHPRFCFACGRKVVDA